ncbi:hypothetical protein VQH23_06255 [Pararoseomonas sp. SCSIO 73927]|uniref:maleate cis-trans isomerase family protein n=1 Tax=Pararoseomonas sp. SCSIO 73927 TaxID=3114537 RepID=UPI0030D59FB0
MTTQLSITTMHRSTEPQPTLRLEYAPHGLMGLLTPQANTTAEAEFGLLCPRGVGMVTARLTSARPGMVDRLLEYIRGLDDVLDRFGNAPIGAYAFACTGASYYVGVLAEDALISRVEASRGVRLVTAACAVRDALVALNARRIGLVSPYSSDMTEASRGYWEARGFEVVRVAALIQPEAAFHPIYTMSGAAAEEALASLDTPDTASSGLDAVVMLGTGLPSLGSILARPRIGQVPVLSCMLALAWRTSLILHGRDPDAASLLDWIGGGDWGPRYRERMG